LNFNDYNMRTCIKPVWNILIVNCITNSCFWNTCVTWQGIGYELPEDDRIMSKHVGVSLVQNCSRVLNDVCFLLGNSPASELHRALPRRKHTACRSVITCETTAHLLVTYLYNCAKYFWAILEAAPIYRMWRIFWDHFHGEMENFLEPQFFNTGCQMYSRNADVIVFIHDAFHKTKMSHCWRCQVSTHRHDATNMSDLWTKLFWTQLFLPAILHT